MVRYGETDAYAPSAASPAAMFSTLSDSSSSHSSGSADNSYIVSVPSVKNGTVTVSPKSASKGDTVTITVKPDSAINWMTSL